MGKPCGRGRDGIKDRPMYHCLNRKTGAVSRVVSPEKVYITALQRTRQTAERLFPQARLVVVEDLGEMNFGRFEGRSAAEMEEDPSYRAWVEGMCRGQCPGGESLPAFSRRVCRAFADCWIGRWPLRKSSLFLWSTGEPRWR